MFATERQRRILEHLRAHGSGSVKHLAALNGCSEPTIRRDLLQLDEQGLVERQRGGASFPRTTNAPSLPPRADAVEGDDDDELSALGALAATLVNDGETIALGAGSAITSLAAALVDKASLTVVTNSLLVGDALATSNVSVVMTGGSLRGSTMSLVGSGAERTFAEMGVRRAFLSGDGLTSTWGLSGADSASVSVDRAIAEAAQEVVVLAQSAAVGVDAMSLTVASARIDDVVIHEPADPQVIAGLRATGVRVHTSPTRAAGTK